MKLLIWSFRQGNVQMATLLVRFGADFALPDAQGFLPLHLVAQEGHYFLGTYAMSSSIVIDCFSKRFSSEPGIIHSTRLGVQRSLFINIIHSPRVRSVRVPKAERVYWRCWTGGIRMVKLPYIGLHSRIIYVHPNWSPIFIKWALIWTFAIAMECKPFLF